MNYSILWSGQSGQEGVDVSVHHRCLMQRIAAFLATLLLLSACGGQAAPPAPPTGRDDRADGQRR
jgi:hypothetical protein